VGLFKDIKNLLIGMRITGKHLGRHAITVQYPEEKWTMPERSRGIVVLLSDKETGELNCTSCLLCARACPTGAIIIDAPRDEAKKRHLKDFTIDFGLCCFCGLCEETCNFSAIKMAAKYEFSTVSKEDLVWHTDKLQEIGRDVPYVDTRKKKVPVVAKPAAPVATTEPATAPVNPGHHVDPPNAAATESAESKGDA
jgi:NADH-quinone oxidoreductase subunit I